MVAKIVKDFIEFGSVQRGFPGMSTEDLSNAALQTQGMEGAEGAMVTSVIEDGPAAKAGILAGDVVVKIDNRPVSSKAFYEEYLAYYRPGSKVRFTFRRKGEEMNAEVTLINQEGNTALLRRNVVSSRVLGADFQPATQQELQKYRITSGIKVDNIRGGSMASMGLKDGTIITRFNGKTYAKAEDLISDLESARGRITIEGINPGGGAFTYNFYGY
jgi:S1-C subfamily serine protease